MESEVDSNEFEQSSSSGSGRVIPTALKCVLLIALFILTFFSGFVPFLLRKAATQAVPESRRRCFALLFGFLSCFGGGVFLATCLLDLLPSTHTKLKTALEELNMVDRFPFGDFLVAIGFFLVLFLEQIAIWWKELTAEYPHSKQEEVIEGSTGEQQDNQRDGRGQHRRSRRMPPRLESIETEPLVDGYSEATWLTESIHFDPAAHSIFRAMVLVFALSLHAIFEGLALGLQTELGVAFQIFAALCIHKVVLAFSLGLRLVQSRLSTPLVVLCCLVFSVMAPLGGFVGVVVTECLDRKYSDMASGCLQGIACGTFLYVTAFEILPHELNEPGYRLWKLVMLVFGFTVICLFLLLYPDN